MEKNNETNLQELEKFLSYHLDDKVDLSNYPKTVEAFNSGKLNISGPIEYILNEPIHKGTEYEKKTIVFKDRVLPNTMASLMRGLDIEKDKGTFSNVIISHIIGLGSKNELDSFSKKDFKFIQEFAPVFM